MANTTNLFPSEAIQKIIESQRKFQEIVDRVTLPARQVSKSYSTVFLSHDPAIKQIAADLARLNEQTRVYSETIRQSGVLQQFEQLADAINAFQKSAEKTGIAESLNAYMTASLDFVGTLDLYMRNKISDIALQDDVVDDSEPVDPYQIEQIEPESMERAKQLFPKLQNLTFNQVITIIDIILMVCTLLYGNIQAEQAHEDAIQAHIDAERVHEDYLDSLKQFTKVDTKTKTRPANPR